MPASPAPAAHRVSFHPSSPIATRSSSMSPSGSPSVSPPMRSRQKRKTPEQDGDDVSEKARSEASTLGGEAMNPFAEFRGSKRAKEIVQRAHRQQANARPPQMRLTEEALSRKEAEGPAFNLRSKGTSQVQTTMRDFAPLTARPSQKGRQEVNSVHQFVIQAVGNGDSSDILKLSVALGYVLEAPASAPSKHVSYLDDIVMAFTPLLRKQAKECAPAVKRALHHTTPDLRELANILLREGMDGLVAAQGGVETDFLFKVATKQKCLLSSAARVSGCLCLWHFIREQLKSEALRVPRLRVLLDDDTAWLSIKFADAERWQHFTVAESSADSALLEWKQRTTHRHTRTHADLVLDPMTPQHWLGLLLQRFWSCAVAANILAPKQLSKWLKLILQLELEHGLGLSASVKFVESVRACLLHLEGDCLPLLLQVATQHVTRRAQRAGTSRGEEAEAELSEEALAAWDGLQRALVVHRHGVTKSTNRSLIATADVIGSAADRTMAAAEKLLCR